MFKIKKRMEISGAHKLNLPYESKCNELHGHNWIIEVEVEADRLDPYGMVVDFGVIKKSVMSLDHKNLDDIFNANVTAECLALVICNMITESLTNVEGIRDSSRQVAVTGVTVIESEGNEACYIP